MHTASKGFIVLFRYEPPAEACLEVVAEADGDGVAVTLRTLAGQVLHRAAIPAFDVFGIDRTVGGFGFLPASDGFAD